MNLNCNPYNAVCGIGTSYTLRLLDVIERSNYLLPETEDTFSMFLIYALVTLRVCVLPGAV